MTDLASKRCAPCEGGVPPLTREQAARLARELNGWEMDDGAKGIRRTFTFDDFHGTMAFVNALAWIAHKENHHPDLRVGYNERGVRYSTHAIDGLSEDDFICAAKIDALV
ncbi:MAG: 4a-hydroxytetrahydrobiopterin dehydratase [Candidatus Eisenbacteria bacterium]